VLGAIEICWNVFPAQPWSSALLLSSHMLLCFAFFISHHSAPHPFSTSAGAIDNKDAKLQ
jgi:hypothetical protein